MALSRPSFLRLHASGELHRRAAALEKMLGACNLCPHLCGNDRLNGEIARCYSGKLPIVSAYAPHFGEEPGLVGSNGVGNIFFGNCNLRCRYCQNHLISQNHREEQQNEVGFERLADIMLELQGRGCHEIGFVSPTHFVPQIVKSLEIAASRGLHLPLVYNTNGFDSVEVLRLLEGIIDIYLPDLKYDDDEMAYRYSRIRGYSGHAKAAIREMHRQVGSALEIGDDGLVKRGLIVRHLVLPNDIAGSKAAIRWLRSELGPSLTVSLMAQYYPAHEARRTPLLDRKIRQSEYESVLALLEKLGLENGWTQEFEAPEYYAPDFRNRECPFVGGAENAG